MSDDMRLRTTLYMCLAIVVTVPFFVNWMSAGPPDQVLPQDTTLKITLHIEDGEAVREWVTCSGKSLEISGTVVIERHEMLP